ncbi:unnamed protein product [Phaedon cochleariae]|uniref:Uncharacterized protein n=1 Tax=Phaedon cochleariae TaxID=80249 RepID=A0A9N9SMQ4_PHACE|nr:unnamed protein product [Phaedon cochleariae]
MNPKSGFSTTGLFSMNIEEILRKISGGLPENLEYTELVFDSSSLGRVFQTTVIGIPAKKVTGNAKTTIKCVLLVVSITKASFRGSTGPFYVWLVCRDSDGEPEEPFADISDEDGTFNPETERDRELEELKSTFDLCYGQQQGRPGSEQAHQSASPGGDYYNPNNAATSGYPPACYSPPQVGPQYPQHPYAAPATGHSLQPMGDYTQLQPQRIPGGSSSHMQHHASSGGQSPGMLNTTPSCKYADSTSSTGVASPQDLSTSGPPNRSTPPLASNPPNNNANSTITSKSSGLTSPLSVSTSPPGKQATGSSTASQNLSSPASSTSSTSSNEKSGSNNNSSKGSSSNPPQIYPWMKRVHLGQSRNRRMKHDAAAELDLWPALLSNNLEVWTDN